MNDKFLLDYNIAVDLLNIQDKKEISVIDIGCGIYRLGMYFQKNNYKNIFHVGLDIHFYTNKYMSRKALEHAGNGSLLCSYVEILPFPNNCFDFVLCCGFPFYRAGSRQD